jgi:hypothetical protein
VRPLIIYIPGLLPKPEASLHRNALFRCLIQGIRRIDASIADDIVATHDSFDIISWTFDFYGEHRDYLLDAAAVDAVIAQEGVTTADMAEATTWKRKMMRWMYVLGDRLPFLIPHIATGRLQLHLRDLRRYLSDDNGIGEHARQMLKMRLRAATQADRPILLIAHSMGSVIAYDSLWQMSREQRDDVCIDRFLTMGSPLGQTYMQKRIHGHAEKGADRYPTNIRRWTNLAAIGDLTAIDPVLANDFSEMVDQGLVEELRDMEVRNYFRLDGAINTHAEYGYLVNEVTARTVARWWREQRHQSET